MTVYLLPVGRGRFELYSEPPDDADAPPISEGRFRRWAHRAAVRWHLVVDAARRGDSAGRVARWRDRVVCRLAETIAEQRTLWALRNEDHAALVHPAGMPSADARAALDRALADARRHHGIWLGVDLPLFIVSAVLAPVPGPNVFAYYLAFRVVGHLLSWRGATRAMKRVTWSLEGDASLAELASLAVMPRDQRAARVHAIATQLNLRRLSAFFQRVAA
jgi:hypothetical protein